MVTSFLTVRSNFDRRSQRSGTAYIWYAFDGEISDFQVCDEQDPVSLSLITLTRAIEERELLHNFPVELQIEVDCMPLIRRYIDDKLTDDDVDKYFYLLAELFETISYTEWKVTFKKAKDAAGKAMTHRAGFNAEAICTDFTRLMDDDDDQIVLPGREN